jgi:hypothetical protein
MNPSLIISLHSSYSYMKKIIRILIILKRFGSISIMLGRVVLFTIIAGFSIVSFICLSNCYCFIFFYIFLLIIKLIFEAIGISSEFIRAVFAICVNAPHYFTVLGLILK